MSSSETGIGSGNQRLIALFERDNFEKSKANESIRIKINDLKLVLIFSAQQVLFTSTIITIICMHVTEFTLSTLPTPPAQGGWKVHETRNENTFHRTSVNKKNR